MNAQPPSPPEPSSASISPRSSTDPNSVQPQLEPPEAPERTPPGTSLSAELGWQCAMDDGDEGWMRVDPAGQILEAGRAAERILQLPRGALAGKPLGGLLGLSQNWVWPPAAQETLRELPGARSGDAALAVALRVAHVGPDGVVCSLVDLGAERAAREQTRRRDRLAVLGELSAGVAHEIRNPLAGIATSAQVLRGRLAADDPKRRFLDVILEEVSRLDRIVTGLLDYARPWTLTLKRIRFEACAHKVRGLVSEQASEQGVEVRVDCPADLPEFFADPDQLTQVLLNLVRNSLEAMPQGGRLEVSGRQVTRAPFVRRSGGRRAEDPALPRAADAPPRPVLLIEVSDTGEGIRPEHLSRLFDPFFTTRASGTGLGLSICQTIIHEHGGSIAASSIAGRGTRIMIELPLEKRHGQRRKDG